MLLVNSDGTLPNNVPEGGFEFISHTGFLFISSKLKGFVRKGDYYIAVAATDRAF